MGGTPGEVLDIRMNQAAARFPACRGWRAGGRLHGDQGVRRWGLALGMAGEEGRVFTGGLRESRPSGTLWQARGVPRPELRSWCHAFGGELIHPGKPRFPHL